jgi:hypothetical protein
LRYRRLFLVGLSGAVALGSVTGSPTRAARGRTATVPRVTPLPLSPRSIPALRLPNYKTVGSYPQVRGPATTVRLVNVALRASVVQAQREYVRLIRRQYGSSPAFLSPNYRYRGLYRTSLRRDLLSASTASVSALVPLRRLLPGGNGGATWIAMTVRVPSGVHVGLKDLFAQPQRALVVVARAAERDATARSKCVRRSLQDGALGPRHKRGFAPLSRNYRYFALTASGFAIGFPGEQVASPLCGRVLVLIPYRVLRPYLSSLGHELIAGVRRPTAGG